MKPIISVIIPVHNGQNYIGKCINALLNMQYPDEKYEIIVVDNNSTDDTATIIKSLPVKYVFEAKLNPYIARNRGASVAQGKILAFIDADCVVHTDWASEIERTFRREDVDALQGYCGGINNNVWAKFAQLDHDILMKRITAEKYLKQIDTRNFAIKRTIFEYMGGFDERLKHCGDWEFGARLHNAGYKAIYQPTVKISHINPTSLMDKINVRRRQGFFAYRMVKLHSTEFGQKYFSNFYRWYYKLLQNSYCRKILPVVSKLLYVSTKTLTIVLQLIVNFYLYQIVLKLAYFHGKLIAMQYE